MQQRTFRQSVWTRHQVALVCATALGMGVLLGAQYSFPLLSLPMARELGWNRSATASVFSLRLLLGAAAQISLGWLIDRYGPRRMGVAGAVLASLGLLISGKVRVLGHLHLSFGVLVAVGAVLVEMSILTALTGKLAERRGTAVGITWAGGGAGMLLMLPLAQWLAGLVSWRFAFGVFALAMACLVPVFWFLFPRELPVAPAVPGGAARWRLLAMPAFWLLLVGNAMVGIYDEAVYQHLVPFAVEMGHAEMDAAAALGLASIMYLAGQAAGGALSDVIGRRPVALGASGLTAAGLFWLLRSGGPEGWQLAGAMLLYGLGLGANLAARSATWGDVFAGPHFGFVAGLISSGYAVGGALISWFGGWSFDARGSYLPAFAAALGAVVLWCVLLWPALRCPSGPVHLKRNWP